MRGFASVAAFVAVAETGSFRLAAGRLGKTPSAVSKAVGRLEDDLGVRLLARTTRSVSLTREGERFLAHALRVLEQLQAGRDAVHRVQDIVRGSVVLTLTPVLGGPVASALPGLLQRYPDLEVVIHASDRKMLLVQEGIDVALRIGDLQDSGLIARRVGTAARITVASPTYLEREGTPRTAEDLATHTGLLFRRPGGGVTPLFTHQQGASTPATVKRIVLANEGNFLFHLARSGGGIAQVFHFMVHDELQTGALVRILEELDPPQLPIHALCAPGQQHTPRVRVVLDWLADVLHPTNARVNSEEQG